ncbi:MAG TPA: hypothetical protein VMG82_09980 [Candidatus Sulfotelmatobacter sp.]|nr:hypothetical protein [Candidatus Sulfotelmatobacter sp.]
MRHPHLLAIALTLIGALTGSTQAQSPPKTNWDEAKAREAALAISKTWKFSPGEFEGGAAKDLQHDVYAVLPFDLPGKPRWILLVATAPPENYCHACSPVSGAVIFALKGDSWQSVYNQPNVSDLGAFGKPPNAHVQSLGPATPAIEFELSSMAQGYVGTNVTFVAEVNQKLREVLSVLSAESNEAADMPSDQTFSWHATVEMSSSIHEGFADIVVKSSGTKPAGKGEDIRPYSETATYRFNGEVYKKVE